MSWRSNNRVKQLRGWEQDFLSIVDKKFVKNSWEPQEKERIGHTRKGILAQKS